MVTEKLFKAKEREFNSFTFAGINIKKEGKNYILNQESFANNIQSLSTDCAFSTFRERRHELAWLTHTRPDLCAAVGFLPQITEKQFNRAAVKLANNTIKNARLHAKGALRQHDLDKESVSLMVFSDSSFANNSDYGTQLGNIILLTDKSRRANGYHSRASNADGS